MASETFTTPGLDSWQAPAGVTSVTVQAWGGGAAGQSGQEFDGSSGGAGGDYASRTIAVTPLSSYDVFVGAGSQAGSFGESSYFGDGTLLKAKGGDSGDDSAGSTINAGGGGAGGSGVLGGGGGGAGGVAGPGTAASGQNNGLGGDAPEGNGGSGASEEAGSGQGGQLYGGGGGGGGAQFGSYGFGADGKVVLTWEVGGGGGGGAATRVARCHRHRFRY